MKMLKYGIGFIVVIVVIVVLVGVYTVHFISDDSTIDTVNLEDLSSVNTAYDQHYKDVLKLEVPISNSTITSPLSVSGDARGYWFFEATAPVFIVDWNGRIIGEGFIQATEPWMTDEYVSFEGVIEFDVDEIQNGYSDKGTLILRQQNASGLPEHDDAFEIPVVFSNAID